MTVAFWGQKLGQIDHNGDRTIFGHLSRSRRPLMIPRPFGVINEAIPTTKVTVTFVVIT